MLVKKVEKCWKKVLDSLREYVVYATSGGKQRLRNRKRHKPPHVNWRD